MKWLTRTGAGITAAAVVSIGALVYWKRDVAAGMSLNEWGDFVAGLSAPLALLWLVIGYFQQGKELQLNTDALKAQQAELRRQVEETAVLAKNSARQAEASEVLAKLSADDAEREHRKVQPTFIFEKPRHEALAANIGAVRTTEFRNVGSAIRDLNVRSDGRGFLYLGGRQIRYMNTNDKEELSLEVEPVPPKLPIEFQLVFTDSHGRIGVQKFRWTFDGVEPLS